MRHIIVTILSLLLLAAPARAQQQAPDSVEHEVLLATTMGNIRVKLYNDTPLHRDNFLSLVARGFYDGLLFHRVIANFMVQAGDPDSRTAPAGALLGENSEGDKLPAEIRFPHRYHKRGALAAAREGDETNPEHKSSGSQFYIVYGRRFNDDGLDAQQDRLDRATHDAVKLTPELREAYKKVGGTPHLDGQYTVFGEVVEGLDVVAQMQWVDTDDNARPLNDVKIVKATQVK